MKRFLKHFRYGEKGFDADGKVKTGCTNSFTVAGKVTQTTLP